MSKIFAVLPLRWEYDDSNYYPEGYNPPTDGYRTKEEAEKARREVCIKWARDCEGRHGLYDYFNSSTLSNESAFNIKYDSFRSPRKLVIKCPQGHVNDKENEFCPKCGNALRRLVEDERAVSFVGLTDNQIFELIGFLSEEPFIIVPINVHV